MLPVSKNTKDHCEIVAGYDEQALIYLCHTFANLFLVMFRNDPIRFA